MASRPLSVARAPGAGTLCGVQTFPYSPLRLVCCALLAVVGCVGARMRPPSPSAAARPWAVAGHSPHANARDRSVRIDRFAVDHVLGTNIAPAGIAAYGRMGEQRQWDYRFSLHTTAGEVLSAECSEAVDHARFYGLGGVALNLACTCREGESVRVVLSFDGEKGQLQLNQGPAYRLSAAYVNEAGDAERALLGYRIHGTPGEGGLDVTARAQAFVPKGLAPADEPALACAYASLLLHRALK